MLCFKVLFVIHTLIMCGSTFDAVVFCDCYSSELILSSPKKQKHWAQVH